MKRRSPIKDLPLRSAGQSVDERRWEIALDRLLAPALCALFPVALWLQDLWRAYRDVPPLPWVTGVMAAIAVAYAVFAISRALPELRKLRLASQGERAVGQGLEELRTPGYVVYHDIPGDNFNIDHVLIGPAGVFTVETKTWSKPAKGRATVIVERDSILVDGRPPLSDPVPQARAQATWLGEILKKHTSKTFPVYPVVVFPGWWIEIKSKPSRLWILNDKALPRFLEKEGARLDEEQIAMARAHLEMFIRARVADA